MLLDLGAFDTVDQDILFTSFTTDVGVKGMALPWLRSYVYQVLRSSGRSQVVLCAGELVLPMDRSLDPYSPAFTLDHMSS